jgi:hypothetical protein
VHFQRPLGMVDGRPGAGKMERQADARRSDLDWMRLAVVCVLAYLPIIILCGALTKEAKSFLGGLSWQSGAYALWEAVAGTFLLAAPATTCGSRRRACPADRRKGT